MGKVTILSVDQSYTRLGYCVQTKTKLIEINSVDLSKMKNPTQKRNCVRELVSILIRKYEPNAVVVERVRIFAGGYISAKVAGMLAAMTAAIVDSAYTHTTYRKSTPVFSVDTRAWKSKVLGNPSASKQDTVKYVQEIFYTNGVADMPVNHDAADAYCIGRYIWVDSPKLQRER